jgi:alcohol dehydrogenase (cytochrome c)
MPYFGLEVTPLAADGVPYVTGPNQVVALQVETGRALWTDSRPPTPGLVGASQLGTNRGVALRGDTVYFVTDNAHLLALDRGTGARRCETPMAPEAPPSEPRQHTPLIELDRLVTVTISLP